MNLILLEREELTRPLAATDARARHIREILKRRIGESFDLGVIDGPRGKGCVREISAEGVVDFTVELGAEPPPLPPLQVIIGLPRPQTAKKILGELTALGVGAMHFVTSERTEPGYAQSTLWRDGEWRELLREGAQQAFCTRLPKVASGASLDETLAQLAPIAAIRLALDNYEATEALGQTPHLPDRGSAKAGTPAASPVILALGPERGWGPKDRAALRAAGCTLVHLGARVLRVETAAVAAVAVIRSRLGWM